MKVWGSIASAITLFVMAGGLISHVSASDQPLVSKRTRVVVERFQRPFATWRQRFFYRGTNAENYYAVQGGYPDPDKTADSVGPGFYIALRGVHPTPQHTKMRLEIKPSIGLEASYLSMTISSAIAGLKLHFIDRYGRPFAVSCVPQSGKHVPVAVRIGSRGLSAIIFEGQGQVPGNVHLREVRVAYGPTGPGYDFLIHEWTGSRCVQTR